MRAFEISSNGILTPQAKEVIKQRIFDEEINNRSNIAGELSKKHHILTDKFQRFVNAHEESRAKSADNDAGVGKGIRVNFLLEGLSVDVEDTGQFDHLFEETEDEKERRQKAEENEMHSSPDRSLTDHLKNFHSMATSPSSSIAQVVFDRSDIPLIQQYLQAIQSRTLDDCTCLEQEEKQGSAVRQSRNGKESEDLAWLGFTGLIDPRFQRTNRSYMRRLVKREKQAKPRKRSTIFESTGVDQGKRELSEGTLSHWGPNYTMPQFDDEESFLKFMSGNNPLNVSLNTSFPVIDLHIFEQIRLIQP